MTWLILALMAVGLAIIIANNRLTKTVVFAPLTLEVMRLRGQQPAWAAWSWLGNAIAELLGPPLAKPPASYPYVWWAHQLATFGLIATLPFTKFLHIVASPANILR